MWEVKKMRVNITVSEEIKAWFEEKSKKTGVAQSALMCMALEEWIFQKEAMKSMSDMGSIISKLEDMQNKIDQLKK